MKPKIVEVEWIDARGETSCLSLRDAPGRVQLVQRFTLGYLVLKDRERLLIAGTYDPKDEHEEEGGADFTVIPRGWVKSIVTLETTVTTKESED